MQTPSGSYHPFNIVGLGWAFSAALVVLFVLCLLASLFIPMRAAHGWVGLFSTAPMDSGRVWIEGVAYSFIAGWIAALVVGLVYNRFAAR